MDYEVELKFRIDEPQQVLALLDGLGATGGDVEEHRDTYFNHPARDFAETDEAFRIRSIGDENRLTYKGPLVDKQTKTRQEVEVGCEAGSAGRNKLQTMLLALAFREVSTVVKSRTPYRLNWQNRTVEATIDVVQNLGTFVELETIAAEDSWESARDDLLALSHELGLRDSERRSYLQLLLSADTIHTGEQPDR
jgi:adenylate cyclase class 2